MGTFLAGKVMWCAGLGLEIACDYRSRSRRTSRSRWRSRSLTWVGGRFSPSRCFRHRRRTDRRHRTRAPGGCWSLHASIL